MSMRMMKYIVPAVLLLTSAPAYAQHGGGHGGGGRAGGGHVGGYSGGYHGGNGGYRGGYGGNRGGYGGYYGGYGGYGYGLGFGLGYGLGYGGYGYPAYGYSYPAYGYSNPSYGYSVPSTYDQYYSPSATPSLFNNTLTTGTVVPAGATSSNFPLSTSLAAAAPAPATVTLIVPSGAQVWLNGKETTASDNNRVVFTSPTLQPGQPSVLSVKASWGGSTYSAQLPIQAGDKFSVDMR